MQAYSIGLDHLPEHIRTFILSEDYFDFLFSLHEKYDLSEEQDTAVVQLISDLYEKRLTIEGIQDALLARVKCDSATAKQLVKEIFVNIILPLRDYYGDWREYFFSTIGTQKDVEASKTMPVIFRMVQEIIEPRVNALETVDYDQEALNVKEVFRRQLIDLHYAPDDDYKIALNELILDLLARNTGYHLELIGEILENEETIGENKIVREGVHYTPVTTEWIRDLHAFSSPDDITTLSIAKYFSQNPNALHLGEKDRGALKRLFETYRVLRHFPESLAKVPRDQWMVIPYDAQKIPGRVFSSTLPPEEVIEGKASPESFLSQIQISRVSSGASSQSQALEPVMKTFEPMEEEIAASALSQPLPAATTSAQDIAQKSGIPQALRFQGAQDLAQKSGTSVGKIENVTPPPTAPVLLDIPEQHVVEPLPSMPPIITSSPSMPSLDYNAQVEEIIKKSGISLSDESLRGRLQTILVTRLRNVRNDTQTKLRLMDPASEGGVGLSEAQVDALLKGIQGTDTSITIGIPAPQALRFQGAQDLAQKSGTSAGMTEKKKEASKVEEKEEIDTPPMKESISTEIKENIKAVAAPPPPLAIQEVDGVPTIVEQGVGDEQSKQKEAKKEKQLGVLPTNTIKTTGIPVPQALRFQGAQDLAQKSGTSAGMTPTAPPPPAMQGKDVKKIPIKMGPASVGGKVSMSDVKTPPRLMDTVEELRFMTLKDFRRLSVKPEEATQKILQKIQLLEKESYTRKMAGIQAWKENEIAKLYLQIGQESFGKGQSIGAVIDQRKAVNQEYLTVEEFDALLDLNEELRV